MLRSFARAGLYVKTISKALLTNDWAVISICLLQRLRNGDANCNVRVSVRALNSYFRLVLPYIETAILECCSLIKSMRYATRVVLILEILCSEPIQRILLERKDIEVLLLECKGIEVRNT